jgi:proline dehydrogenase
MAFKVSKEQSAQIKDLAKKLVDQVTAIEATQATANETIAAALATVVVEVERYNELLGEARELVETIGTDLRSEYDDKSEKWQASDKGQDVNSFIEQYESTSFDDLDVPEIEEIALDIEPVAEALEELPEEI